MGRIKIMIFVMACGILLYFTQARAAMNVTRSNLWFKVSGYSGSLGFSVYSNGNIFISNAQLSNKDLSLPPNGAASDYIWKLYNGAAHKSTDQLGSILLHAGNAEINHQVDEQNSILLQELVQDIAAIAGKSESHTTALRSSVVIGTNVFTFLIYPKSPAYSVTFQFFVRDDNGIAETIREIYFDNTTGSQTPNGQPIPINISVVSE
ncbi:hypothetical protein [Methylocella sp.]|uniref:hypothetical protein n=1 Tax=Methylocella sp. TaxID=1978226 RepID=UPI0035AEF66A